MQRLNREAGRKISSICCSTTRPTWRRPTKAKPGWEKASPFIKRKKSFIFKTVFYTHIKDSFRKKKWGSYKNRLFSQVLHKRYRNTALPYSFRTCGQVILYFILVSWPKELRAWVTYRVNQNSSNYRNYRQKLRERIFAEKLQKELPFTYLFKSTRHLIQN